MENTDEEDDVSRKMCTFSSLYSKKAMQIKKQSGKSTCVLKAQLQTDRKEKCGTILWFQLKYFLTQDQAHARDIPTASMLHVYNTKNKFTANKWQITHENEGEKAAKMV